MRYGGEQTEPQIYYIILFPPARALFETFSLR